MGSREGNFIGVLEYTIGYSIHPSHISYIHTYEREQLQPVNGHRRCRRHSRRSLPLEPIRENGPTPIHQVLPFAVMARTLSASFRTFLPARMGGVEIEGDKAWLSLMCRFVGESEISM